ncbi:MarR family EPS-associated transcriptional regulator [Brachymonas denitrificans]|uniref:MarR family EPS-associated transcriptional regulator n=1 Tax=Brachymonas denitrificans TaxID=28220 RepID=UPI00321F9FEB
MFNFEQKSTPLLSQLKKNFMPSCQAQRQEDIYYRVLQLLQTDPDLTQRELASQVGVSVGRLNYCLNALIDKGWVKMQNFARSKNKFGYVYVLTPSGVAQKAALTSQFLKRKIEEYEILKAEIEVLRFECKDQSRSELS